MRISILDVPIDVVTSKQALEWISQTVRTAERPYFVATPNPEMVVLAQRDQNFLQALQATDLSVPDGFGLLWAAKRQGTPLPERVTGVDLTSEICRWASETGHSVYLLGGEPGVAEAAADILKEHYPKLKVVGAESGGQVKRGSFGAWCLPDDAWNNLEQAKPEILLVAFGHGKQEEWIKANLHCMPWLKIAIGIGGSFDFISGKTKRAPKLFQKIKLEWLWRLIAQPSRWHRIFNAVIVFPYLIFKAKD